MWAADRPREPNFASESGGLTVAGGRAPGHDLEGHYTPVAHVPCLIDDAHIAAAQDIQQRIVRASKPSVAVLELPKLPRRQPLPPDQFAGKDSGFSTLRQDVRC